MAQMDQEKQADKIADPLAAILGDPAALSAAVEMAKSLLGSQGAQSTPEPTAPPEVQAPPAAPRLPGLSGEDDKTRLLLALRPFLSPKRSEKVGTVLTLMRGLQLMGGLSLFDFGGDA